MKRFQTTIAVAPSVTASSPSSSLVISSAWRWSSNGGNSTTTTTAPPPSSNTSNAGGSGWRQQVLDRTTQQELGLASDKTFASGAILTEQQYEENKKALGGTTGMRSASSLPAPPSSSRAVGRASGKGNSGGSAQSVEEALKLEAERDAANRANGFSFADHFRRRWTYLLLVRGRRIWAPLLSYVGLLSGMNAVIASTTSSGQAAAAAAAAMAAEGGAVTLFSALSMPHYLSAAAAVGVLNALVVGGTRSKWLKKAKAQRQEVLSSSSSVSAEKASSSNAAATSSSSSSSSPIAALPLYRQVAVITGATGALGREIAKELQSLGAMVIVTHLPGAEPLFGMPSSPTPSSSSSQQQQPPTISPTAVITQTNAPPNTIPMRSYPLDLANRVSINTFCGLLANSRGDGLSVPKIDLLILAAGVREHRFVPTLYGNDRHVEVNFLGHFLLTENLLPLIRRSQYSGVGFDGMGPGAVRPSGNTTSPATTQPSAASSFPGVRGGRIVYVSCTSHALVGSKYPIRTLLNAYADPNSTAATANGVTNDPLLRAGRTPSSVAAKKSSADSAASTGEDAAADDKASGAYNYRTKWLEEGDDGYVSLYGLSKLGNIFHTTSLHERRYNGIDGTAQSSADGKRATATTGGGGASSSNSNNSKPLRPYTAVCAVLPPFQSHLSRGGLAEEPCPPHVSRAREAAGLTFGDKKKQKKASSSPLSSLSSSSSPTVPLVGSDSVLVSDESAVQSFAPSQLIGAMRLQTAQRAAETVLDACLRPDAESGGFYHENREMSQHRARRHDDDLLLSSSSSSSSSSFLRRVLPLPAQVFEVLSATALDVRSRQSMIGWAVQQTRRFVVSINPNASQQPPQK